MTRLKRPLCWLDGHDWPSRRYGVARIRCRRCGKPRGARDAPSS